MTSLAAPSSGAAAPAGSDSATVRAVPSDGDASKPLGQRLLDEEKREIVAAIDRSQGNIAGAARLLGINRSTLYYRMRKHGLEHLAFGLHDVLMGERQAEPVFAHFSEHAGEGECREMVELIDVEHERPSFRGW